MSAALSSPKRPPRTVLLGFSDDAGRRALADHLAALGLRVLMCHDPGELATHAAADRPALIVTDFLLQRLDGFTMHRLLQATRSVPVMLRAPGSTRSRRQALARDITGALARQHTD